MQNKGKFYISQDELRKELCNYIFTCKFRYFRDRGGNWRRKIKERGKISDRLGQMIWTIAEGLSMKGNWRGYTWREDFVSQAVLTTLKYMHNFNYKKNPHAYISWICQNAFLQHIRKEKNHGYIKQKLYENKYLVETSDEETLNYEKLCEKEEEE